MNNGTWPFVRVHSLKFDYTVYNWRIRINGNHNINDVHKAVLRYSVISNANIFSKNRQILMMLIRDFRILPLELI